MPEQFPFTMLARFKSLTEQLASMTTDEAVSVLDAGNYWDPEVLEHVVITYKRDHVRKMLGRVQDEEGGRLFINLQIVDDSGRRRNIYKLRRKMSVDEFRQAVQKYAAMGSKGFTVAKMLIRECRDLHHVQLRLPFRPD